LLQLRAIEAPFCQCCGNINLPLDAASGLCRDCRELRHSFRFARAGFKLCRLGRKLLHECKYARRSELCAALASLAMQAVLSDARLHGQSWLLVPVPMSRRRRAARWFNQAELMVKHLEKLSGWPSYACLQRSSTRLKQAWLGRELRRQNMQDGISLVRGCHREVLQRHNILLVDDTFTTGATADACCEVLRQAARHRRMALLSAFRS